LDLREFLFVLSHRQIKIGHRYGRETAQHAALHGADRRTRQLVEHRQYA
jgi:hypothetical protein